MKKKKRLLIDLDGVLNEYRGSYDENFIPAIKNGAKEFLKNLIKTGQYELYLFSTRDSDNVKIWLIENDINEYFKGVTNVKVPAYLIIDDRAVCFTGQYDLLFEKIEKFNVWWK